MLTDCYMGGGEEQKQKEARKLFQQSMGEIRVDKDDGREDGEKQMELGHVCMWSLKRAQWWIRHRKQEKKWNQRTLLKIWHVWQVDGGSVY